MNRPRMKISSPFAPVLHLDSWRTRLAPTLAILIGVAGCADAVGEANRETAVEHLWSDNNNGLQSWPDGEIEVCFQPYSQADYDESTWYAEQTERIRDVVEAAYETIPGVSVDLYGWEDCDDWANFQVGTKPGTLRVLVRTVTETNNFAYRQAWRVANLTSIGDAYDGTLSGYDGDKESVIGTSRSAYSLWDGFDSGILHEFGHLLGFDHEFMRDDNEGACEVAEGNNTVGTFLTVYDEESIMNETYCGFRPALTAIDELGVEIVYPGSDYQPLAGTFSFRLAGGMVIRDNGVFTTDWTRRGALPDAFDDGGDSIAWSSDAGGTWGIESYGLEYPADELPITATSVSATFDDFAGRGRSVYVTEVFVNNSRHTAILMSVL